MAEFFAELSTGKHARNASKAAFGQELRLALCIYVGRHPTGLFTLSDAAATLGVSPSALQGPMKSLVDIAVVSRTDLRPGTRERWLSREPSALWSFAEELLRGDAPGQMSLEFS